MSNVWLISACTGDWLDIPCIDLALVDDDQLSLSDADRQWMTGQGFTQDNPDECMYAALDGHGTFPSRAVPVTADVADAIGSAIARHHATQQAMRDGD